MLTRLISFLRAAGAKSEEDSDRDGFLSYHAESHAVAFGLLFGGGASLAAIFLPALVVPFGSGGLSLLAYAVTGRYQLRGMSKELAGKYVADVRAEPHYYAVPFVVSAAPGAVLHFGVV